MVTLFGSHKVSDYDAWIAMGKQAMRDKERRAQSGIVESHVYRVPDSDRVIVTHTFNTLEQAQQYAAAMDSPESQARLEEFGSKPPYTFWVAEEVDL